MLRKTIENILRALAPPNIPLDEESHRQARLRIISFLATALFLGLFAVLYLVISFEAGVYACLYGMAVTVVLLLVFRRTANYMLVGRIFDVNAYLMFGILIYGTGGIHSSIVPWLIIMPTAAFVFEGWRTGLVMSIPCLGAVISLFVATEAGVDFPLLFDPRYAASLDVLVIVGLLAYILMVLLIYEIAKERTISELGELNAEVRRINANLENLVGERTQELHMAKSELDTFLYEASHALRRPLARIIGLMQIIRSSEKAEQGMHEMVDTTAVRMDEMLTRLVLVSEINDRNLEPQALNLRTAVDAALERAQQRISESQASITVDVPSSTEVQADQALFPRFLDFLLENALDYHAPDRPLRVRVEWTEADGRALLRIRDNGEGIPDSELPKIGTMFFRATARSVGSGLSLYVIRKGMAAFGGWMEVRSREGEGTEVLLGFG